MVRLHSTLTFVKSLRPQLFHLGKTLLAVSTMFRREYGIRDAHRKIHIVSPHAVAGEFDNPLEPIIEEADADPDGKFILEPGITFVSNPVSWDQGE